MAHLGAPPSGWYVDPSGRHRARYWDGSSWTTHVTDDISSDDSLRPPPGIDGGMASVSVDQASVFNPEYVSAAAEATAGVETAVAAISAGGFGDPFDMSQPAAGWYPDPTGRHEVRFWDGLQWTDRVATQGLEAIEPVGEPMYGIGATGVGESDLPPLSSADDDPGSTRRRLRRRAAKTARDEEDEPESRTERAHREATAAISVASRVAGVFVLAGAAALIVGSTMDWIKVSGPTLTQQSVVSGFDGDGRVTAGVGIVLALFGLGLLTGRFVKIGGIRIGAMGVLVAGAAALAICGLNMADVIDRAPRLGIEAGATADFAQGLWVSFGGVVTAIVGGLLAFTHRESGV